MAKSCLGRKHKACPLRQPLNIVKPGVRDAGQWGGKEGESGAKEITEKDRWALGP